MCGANLSSKARLQSLLSRPFSTFYVISSMISRKFLYDVGSCKKLMFTSSTDDEKVRRHMKRMRAPTATLPRMKPVSVSDSNKNAPTLVIGGENDLLAPPELVEDLAKQYNTQSVLFKGMAHMVMFDERWPEVADKVLQFFEETCN